MAPVFGRDRVCPECKGQGEIVIRANGEVGARLRCYKCSAKGYLSDNRYEPPKQIEVRDENGETLTLDVT